MKIKQKTSSFILRELTLLMDFFFQLTYIYFFFQEDELADFIPTEDMLIDALDYGPPENILIISCDIDFARPMLVLKNRGFRILLAEIRSSNKKL